MKPQGYSRIHRQDVQRHCQLINLLRVFRSAHTAHLGRGVGQEHWLRVRPSEKYAARCVSLLDEMRMKTACFACAPQRCTRCLSKHFLLTFQEVTSLTKTRNQLKVIATYKQDE